jgi:ABC-2 type transport system permease protein
MTLKRGETLLLTLGIPVLLLVFFSTIKIISLPGKPITFIAPGIIALCVMSTSMVSLSIATGFERSYGVLRRLHVTPLSRREFIGAKITAVFLVEILQVVVVSAVAVALGWRPQLTAILGAEALAAAALGSMGFAGIGLLLAGRLRAEMNLAATNGLYLLLLLVSGFVVPAGSLPSFWRHVMVVLPSGALTDGLHRCLGHGTALGVANFISLAAWAIASPLLAARSFRLD